MNAKEYLYSKGMDLMEHENPYPIKVTLPRVAMLMEEYHQHRLSEITEENKETIRKQYRKYIEKQNNIEFNSPAWFSYMEGFDVCLEWILNLLKEQG